MVDLLGNILHDSCKINICITLCCTKYVGMYDENKWVLVMLWNPFCIEHVDRKINLATMIFSNFLSNLELHFFTDALIIKVDCFSDLNFDWNLKEFHSQLVLPTEKFNVYTQARLEYISKIAVE